MRTSHGGHIARYSGECIWREFLESGSRRSVLCSCISYVSNVTSVDVKMVSYSTYFTKNFHKLSTCNVFCKDDAVINCITVQH
jgi:hypothetical protein